MSDTSADWANPGSPRSKHRPSPRRNASSNTCRGDSATMSPARSGLNEIRRSASRESSSVDDDVEVDQVVVDNDWSSWEGADAKSEILSTTGLRRQSSHYSRRSDSVANDNIHGSDDLAQSTSPTWHTLRYRVYPAVKYFFDQSFEDREREAQFQREIWWNGKLMCFIGALYFLLNFILYAADVSESVCNAYCQCNQTNTVVTSACYNDHRRLQSQTFTTRFSFLAWRPFFPSRTYFSSCSIGHGSTTMSGRCLPS